MTSSIEISTLTLAAAAKLIEAREVSPLELTQAAIERAERLEPRLNAYFTRTFDTALREAGTATEEIAAGRSRGALHGIPVALKDLYETAGVRTTAGSPIRDAFVPTEDAFAVGRLKEAGAVLLGKLNMHEWALGGTNVNAHYPSPRNPWDTERITGGSSGGSAAAIAAGYCLGTLGSDSRGSIRIPASLCGVTGFKPTYGRVSVRGVVPLYWSLDHAGPIARTAEDCALLLQAIAGYDRADALSADLPVPDYVSGIEGGLAGIRIGVPRRYFFDESVVQKDVLDAVDAALVPLRQLGATIEEVDLPDFDQYSDNSAFLAETAAFHEQRLREQPEGFSDVIRTRLRAALEIRAVDYANARLRQLEYKRLLRSVFERVDLLLTPTTPITALTIEDATPGAGDTASVAAPGAQALLIRNTTPFNTSGSPVISVPCGFNREGLPIGMSLTGRDWEEALVLRAAHAYQGATDWHRRRPPLDG